MRMEFNINDYVLCELTEHGANEITKRGYKPKYNNNGLLKIQMWELMQELGDSILNGEGQCILDNRIIWSNQLADK